jgi:hypothetical protein
MTAVGTTYIDAGVGGRGVGRDGGQEGSGRDAGSAAGDDELGTLWVPLGGVGLVESQQLVPDQVVSWGQAGRDGGGPLESGLDDGGSPAGAGEGRCSHSHLVNLEPVWSLAIACGERAIAVVHPDHDGSLLMRPLRPEGGDAVTGSDGGAEGGAGSAITGHLGIRDGEHGVVVGPLPFDGRGARSW